MMKCVCLLFILSFYTFVYAGNCSENLFYIAKSNNNNVLYYDVNMDGQVLDKDDPVKIYWIKHFSGGEIKTLSFLERPHFGLDFKAVESGKIYNFNFRNSQLDDNILTLTLKPEGCAEVTTRINGENAVLTDIFINLSQDGGLVPDVESIDLNGINTSGIKITEKIIPK